ncbi:MAG: hypothetical protein ACKO7B_16605, partial [Flavobacteriales bacterium]
FESSMMESICCIQLATVLLAISLLLYFISMHDEYFARLNPLLDAAVICVFFGGLSLLALFLLQLVDLALIRFF